MQTDTRKLDSTYIAHTYLRFPVEIVSGQGATVQDASGKTYIDLGSGIAVNSFGVNDPVWKAAVLAQLDKVQHASNLYYTQPQAELAQVLCEKTGMKKVFFGNSGAEANECAIKAARKYASDKYGEGVRPNIVTLINSFHGRTITTLSATGQDVFHHSFGPFTPGFLHVPAGSIPAMQAAIRRNDVCAVMMEMVQGEGGVLPLDPEFVRATAKLCEENDVLLIVDEVQTGNGRTGTMYAYEQFAIAPDVVSTAKGIGGGLPIGVCLLGEKTQDVLGPSAHGSTFGGNPVCAAGALSIVKRIDEALLSDVRRKSARLVSGLQAIRGVRSVTGLGLMLGVQTEKNAKEIVLGCIEKGVLMLTAKDKIRLLPALNITDGELEQALKIIKEVIEA